MIPPWLILVPIGFALAAFGLAKSALAQEEKENETSHPKADEQRPRRDRRDPVSQPSDGDPERDRAGRVTKERQPHVRVVNPDVARGDRNKPSVDSDNQQNAASTARKAKPVEANDGPTADSKATRRKSAKSKESAGGAPEGETEDNKEA